MKRHTLEMVLTRWLTSDFQESSRVWDTVIPLPYS